MPPAAFVAIGLALESAAGAWLIVNAAALSSAALVFGSVAANAAMQRRSAAKSRAAYNASLKDREVMIRSAVAPRRAVLGRDKVSGPIVYAESTGSKGQFLHLVIALADGECDDIETVYFNDVALPDADASGFIQSGDFSYTRKKPQFMYGAGASGGVVTLPHNASGVQGISTIPANDSDFSTIVTGWSHTSGSPTITGLPSGLALRIDYEYLVVQPRVRIKKHRGQPGQVAEADLVAESAGKWTAAHTGTGVCYLYVRLEYDVEVFGQVGVPNISAVVRGRKLYDPRTATTVWSENAALCAAHWLRDSGFGLSATIDQVPAAEVIAAANVCDELVQLDALGATQKRYTFNGSFTSDESPRDVLADLLTGMAGNCIWVQGRWLVRAGAYRTPELTLTEDHLAGSSVSIIPRASRGELFNAVRVSHRDPAQAWAEVQAALVVNAGYEAQDGRQIVRSLALPAAMDPLRAQRLGKIMLERARQAVTLQITTNLRAYDLAPTDTVAVTLPRYGFAGKVFEVRERTWSTDGTLQYTLQETASGVWAWNYGEATVGDLAPDTVLPSPYTPPAPLAGLSVESGTEHLLLMADGTIVSRAWVQWTQSSDAFVTAGGRIEAQWLCSCDADWQATPAMPGDAVNTYLQPMPDDVVLIRVRAVNAAGRSSDWTTGIFDIVGKSAAPRDVAGLAYAAGHLQARLRWDTPADIDYAFTVLRVGGTGWADAVPLTFVAADSYVWTNVIAGTYTVRAKHYDTTGNQSATAASLSVTIAPDITLGSLGQKTFRVASTGFSATGYPAFAGLYDAETNASLVTYASMWRVAKIARATGVASNVGGFNILDNGVEGSAGGINAANAMAAALNAIGPDHVVVVFTQDEPSTNRMQGALPAAVYRCGASRAVFGSAQFKYRAAYVLIGIPGCGEGNGAEGYQCAVSNDPNAWVDMAFSLLNGNLIGVSNSYNPRTLSDYGYVATDNIEANAVTSGAVLDSSETVGSTGSPGAQIRVASLWGPAVTTAAGDELDIVVSGVLSETFWSQAAIGSVELWLTRAPEFGGTQTEFGTRRKFLTPIDVYTNTTNVPLDMTGQITPGAGTQTYVLRVSVTYKNGSGVNTLCAKDFTANAQWRVVRRKR